MRSPSSLLRVSGWNHASKSAFWRDATFKFRRRKSVLWRLINSLWDQWLDHPCLLQSGRGRRHTQNRQACLELSFALKLSPTLTAIFFELFVLLICAKLFCRVIGSPWTGSSVHSAATTGLCSAHFVTFCSAEIESQSAESSFQMMALCQRSACWKSSFTFYYRTWQKRQQRSFHGRIGVSS